MWEGHAGRGELGREFEVDREWRDLGRGIDGEVRVGGRQRGGGSRDGHGGVGGRER